MSCRSGPHYRVRSLRLSSQSLLQICVHGFLRERFENRRFSMVCVGRFVVRANQLDVGSAERRLIRSQRLDRFQVDFQVPSRDLEPMPAPPMQAVVCGEYCSPGISIDPASPSAAGRAGGLHPVQPQHQGRSIKFPADEGYWRGSPGSRQRPCVFLAGPWRESGQHETGSWRRGAAMRN